MTRLLWDQVGERRYETGVDLGVLYLPNVGVYDNGYAWNGLTAVTESPSGADFTPQYADNIKYLNLQSAEDFGGTIEAFTYPDQFAQCDGSLAAQAGVVIGQQTRKPFGLCYRTRVGNDVLAADYGYKLHLLYGALAAPSEKAFSTINDTPAALAFSWAISTVPAPVTGQKPSALLIVDSTKVGSSNLTALENALYGTAGSAPRLPLPDEVITMFAGAITTAVPSIPVYTSATHTIAIPTVTGVTYRRGDTNAVVAGGSSIVLTVGQQLLIKALPNAGYVFAAQTADTWQYNY